MAARGHFVFPIDDKNHRVLVIWDLNGYGEYEFDRCICDKVMACTSVGVRRRRRRRRRRNQNHNITGIFKFRGYNKKITCHKYNLITNTKVLSNCERTGDSGIRIYWKNVNQICSGRRSIIIKRVPVEDLADHTMS